MVWQKSMEYNTQLVILTIVQCELSRYFQRNERKLLKIKVFNGYGAIKLKSVSDTELVECIKLV